MELLPVTTELDETFARIMVHPENHHSHLVLLVEQYCISHSKLQHSSYEKEENKPSNDTLIQEVLLKRT